ncbi:MAG: branched-chain amino acid ABC transporter permease [Rhodospirillum sp.]|nr:branched-chain amino acid ABC transporter permease [Rhodospirillum sp.]MCF8490076.1 branched-chain amino acid ABC transporter permease [Rhodospirillum sp.]MCF8500435.1 branched-chain amino acid ABC transporter permease [Rhodospirillum sp.]
MTDCLPHPPAPPASTRYSVVTQTRFSRMGEIALILVAIALCLMPWWGDRGLIRTATEFLYVLALAQTWNLLAGYGGLVSIGQQAFIGLGGYCLVVFGVQMGVNIFLVIPIAAAVSALVAIPAGVLLFRLRGAYFAVGTWVVAEVLRLLTANTTAVGGGSGTSITTAVKGIPAWWRESLTLWIAIVLGLGAIALGYLFLRSRNGLALQAIRDSEPASESLGIRVDRMRWTVYLLAAAGCGAVGALIFISKLRISPEAAYSLDWTTTMFFIVVIGGIGTLEGPILGTILFFALRGLLSGFGSWYLILLGAVAVLVMVRWPDGLWGLLSRKWDLALFPTQRRVVAIAPRKEDSPHGSR